MNRILIAEDERDIRELVTLTLQFNGYEVVGRNISQDNNIESVNIFPNPSKGLLFINCQNLTNWRLTNVNGQVLKEGITKEINTDNLPVGLYFLHICRDDNNITKRIVID